jgi:multicomponent K+:H+ antiporter subunit G
MTAGAVLLEALISLLILSGAFFTLAGSIGLVRFPDFFLRLHGPTKATTLGVGSLLLASAIFFSWETAQIRFPETLIMLFLFMTAPVSAHLLAKAALHLGVASSAALPRRRPQAPGWSSGDGGPELAPAAADRAAPRGRSDGAGRASD